MSTIDYGLIMNIPPFYVNKVKVGDKSISDNIEYTEYHWRGYHDNIDYSSFFADKNWSIQLYNNIQVHFFSLAEIKICLK